jgi:DNA-binding TFAR19-related protein (PDSD5 family)
MPPSGAIGSGANRVHRITESWTGSPDATPSENGFEPKEGAGGSVDAVVVVLVLPVDVVPTLAVVTGGADVDESPLQAARRPPAPTIRNERRVSERGGSGWAGTAGGYGSDDVSASAHYGEGMRGRRHTFGSGLIVLTSVLLSTPAAAGDTITPGGVPTQDPGFPGGGGFAALLILGFLVSVGIAIWKFSAIRDMGMRRGMSRKDATTAAIFSDESVVLGMVLKDESRPRMRRNRLSRPPPTPTLEERLKKLERLRVADAITDEEAAQRRAEILDEI